MKTIRNKATQHFFPPMYSFLQKENTTTWHKKRVFWYLVFLVVSISVSRKLADYSEPYHKDNLENKKFTSLTVQNMRIIDTLSTTMQQSCFNSYKAIQLENGNVYRIQLQDITNWYKIVPGALLSKNASENFFTITNKQHQYTLYFSELDNTNTKNAFMILSAFLVLVFLPLFWTYTIASKK